MSQYLRDERLRNLSFSEEALTKINEEVLEIAMQINKDLDIKSNDEVVRKKIIIPSYIIRFDNKGFRLYDFGKIIKHFREAHRIERFIFSLESIESIRTSKMSGKSIELRLDANDSTNCFIVVQDDDSYWVDSVFCKLKECLSEYKNMNFLIQNRAVPFCIQLCGVIFGFLVSLWVATKIAPKLAIDNALAFAFVIIFLLFSNVWTWLYEGILRCFNYFWPNIQFKERGGIHWLVKAIISSAFVGGFFFILNQLFIYCVQMMRTILK